MIALNNYEILEKIFSDLDEIDTKIEGASKVIDYIGTEVINFAFDIQPCEHMILGRIINIEYKLGLLYGVIISR